jgi:hypothetical protein
MPDDDLLAAAKYRATAKRKLHEHSWQGVNLVTGSGGYSKEQIQHGTDDKLDWECSVCTKTMRVLAMAHTGKSPLGYKMCSGSTCEAIICTECNHRAILSNNARPKRRRTKTVRGSY